MPRKVMIAQPDFTGADGMSVQVEVTIPGRQRARQVPKQTQPSLVSPRPTPPRIPRIARLMALAIKFQDLVDRGEVRDYADLARLGYVTRARITQILNLLNLAPDLQEQILYMRSSLPRGDDVTERDFRSIARAVYWSRQRRMWGELTHSRITGK